jgi:hypothetical protein
LRIGSLVVDTDSLHILRTAALPPLDGDERNTAAILMEGLGLPLGRFQLY